MAKAKPSYTKGWDYFTPYCEEDFEYKNCLVCGAKFNISKGDFGPTGFVEAMGGGGHKHDTLTCPNTGGPNTGGSWHYQALSILKEARETSSSKLKKMLEDEAAEIVKTQKPTIPGFKKYFGV